MVLAKDQFPSFEKGLLVFGTINKFQYSKSLEDEIKDGMDKKHILQMYQVMLYNRVFEEMIISLRNGKFVPYSDYRFVGATHLSIGQEAVAIGAIAPIRKTDFITSTHRGHGHSIAKGAFFLFESNQKELHDFISKVYFKSNKNTLIEQAMDVHMYRTMAEFLGKEDGYCGGKGGGMHIADFSVGHLGANAIVGGSLGIATGAALSLSLQDRNDIVLCFHGDGSTNNGIWHESLNMACMAHFKEKGVPVIFLVENNLYGMTGQGSDDITGIDYIARRAFAYNKSGMNAEIVNGMDVLAVRDGVLRAAKICRDKKGPVLLEAITYRYKGHSLSDPEKYRSKTEVEAWKKEDPIQRLEREIIENGLMTEELIKKTHYQTEENIRYITEAAARSADPKPTAIFEGLFSGTTTDSIRNDLETKKYNSTVIRDRRDQQGYLSYRHAINEALVEEMLRDKRVILYGEDVAEHGGAFGATNNLHDIFGRYRVFNSPISESAIIGAAVGMGIVGLRPVAELMYIDFILMAMDQVGNQAAKIKYMFGGHAVVPIVIRTAIGGGKGYAGQHSQSLEAIPAHIPGLKIVVPSTPYDAKGLLKSAIRDDNPVIFIEHQLLYNLKGPVPNNDYIIPLGEAVIKKIGNDVTIVTYSYMVNVALKAAEFLEKEGISTEVIDIRTIYPLDVVTINNSVRKTGCCIVLNQAPKTGCFGEHIACEVQSAVFDYLDHPIEVVGALDVPPPMSQTLERNHIPDTEKVINAVKKYLIR